MSTIRNELFEAFLTELSKLPQLDESQITRIKALLLSDRRPKVDDFIQVFIDTRGGDIK